MTLNRYTSYAKYSKSREPTRGVIAASLKDGALQELQISDDGEHARWVTDRIVFPQETSTYGGLFPYESSEMFECGLYCTYQDDFDSIGRQHTFSPISSGGGIASLSKIAPLYDVHSLMLTGTTVDASASSAGLYYNAKTPNNWATLEQQDFSLDFYFKTHRAETVNTELWLAFNAGTSTAFGLKLRYAASTWSIGVLRNNTTTWVPITITRDLWDYVVFNKTADSGGNSTYTLYLNGSSIWTDTSASPLPEAYTSFSVLGTGLSNTSTAFFVSNLRVDTNTVKTSFAPTYMTDYPVIGLSQNHRWVYDNSGLDPFYDKVTCLTQAEHYVSGIADYGTIEGTSPISDMTGYCQASIRNGAAYSIVAGTPNLRGEGYGGLFADFPRQVSTSLTKGNTTTNVLPLGATLSVQGFNYGYVVPADIYVPWLQLAERGRNSMTFDGDFTFEFWTHPIRPGTYIFSTVGGIAMVDGTIVGIGATFSIGTFGVDTGIYEWSHVALARQGSQLRVFINAVEVASVTRSGTITFNGLEFAAAPGTTPGAASAKYFSGVLGQVRLTKACRYVTGADIVSSVYTIATRVENAHSVISMYDSATDYCYGLVPWMQTGDEGATPDITRLTLFKFDPRSKTVVARRDIWKKSVGFKYPSPFNGRNSLNSTQVRSFFTLVGNNIVLTRDDHEYAFFKMSDLSDNGVYASWKDDVAQHRSPMKAGPDRYVTWQEYALSGSTAVSDPGAGRVVLQLHFADYADHYIFKDMAGHPVINNGIIFDPTGMSGSGSISAAYFDATRTGLLTIQGGEDFAFKGDFTLEFEARFDENAAGAVTACTVYEQTGITISAVGLTITATVFGTPITFVGTGSGSTATFGAIQYGSTSQYTKTHHIALCRAAGEIRFFLNGVLVNKVTDATQGVASNIVLGNNFRGWLDEVTVWNGYAKYATDATFVPSRYTAVATLGIPIKHRNNGTTNNSTYMNATGMFPASINTLVAGRRSRKSDLGMITFDQELQSATATFSANSGIHQDSVIYHESTDTLWFFGSAEKTGAGDIGYRWDFATNTLTPIPKQGNMVRVLSTGGAFVHHFNTVSATNITADFGKAVNRGLTITQAVARAPFYGSLVMSKGAEKHARTAVTSSSNSMTTGNWTIELWYYNTVLQAEATPDVLFSDKFDHSPRWEIGVQRSAVSCMSTFRVYNGFQTVALTSLALPEEDVGVNTWVHLALVRSGTSIFGYTNGVKTHTYTLSSAVDMTGTFSEAFIGASSLLTNFATGRIQEVGISNGLARYTGATYTPPTEPFISRSSSTSETILPLSVWAYKDDIILAARIGNSFGGAYRFNAAGTLTHTYGFAGFDDDLTAAASGGNTTMYLGPRTDIEHADLDTPGIDTHVLYGFGRSPNTFLYIWELGTSSVEPTRRLAYTSSGWPYTSTGSNEFNVFPSTQSTGAYQILAPSVMYIGDNSKEVYRNVPIRKPKAAVRAVAVGFEDIINPPPVPQPDIYPDVAVGAFYATSHELTFGPEAAVSRSYSYGGFGRFGPRTPAAARGGEAAMALTGSPCVISSTNATAFVDGLSFWHASSASFTVELWSQVNATGSLVGTVTVTPTGTCSLPDANNIYCTWAKQELVATGSFRSIKLSGTPGTFFIDDLTFGSLTPFDTGVRLINGSNVAAAGYVLTPPASPIVLPVPATLSSGVLTADMTAPYTPVTKDVFLPVHDNVPAVNAVNWHKITHDGSKTLKITLIQPSDLVHSALQNHNVNSYLGVVMYDAEGNVVQRLYQAEEMNAYIGVQAASGDSTLVKPYALPLVIPKAFPAGDYYIATINRKPTGPRLFGDGTFESTSQYSISRSFLQDFGFGAGASGAPDTGILIQPNTPIVSISGETWPPVDTVLGHTVEAQGSDAGTLVQQTATPLAGTGSIEFTLSTVGPSQEVVTEDPFYWLNVFLLAKLDGNYTDSVANRATSLVTSSFNTTYRQLLRFGTGAMTDGGSVSWSYTTELPYPDRNAITLDMYLYTSGYHSSSLGFHFNGTNTYLRLTLARAYATTQTHYKLTVAYFTLADGITSVDSPLFDIPPAAWAHFAIVKTAPVANSTTLYVYVNGVAVSSVTLSIPAPGYVSDANKLALAIGTNNGNGYLIDNFRVTTAERWTPPGKFTPPHYPMPDRGVGPPPPPVTSFNASTLTGAPPLTVTFTDTSTRLPTSWAWDFTDDSVIDATTQNTSFTYTSAGTYVVRLTATNAGGSTSATKTINVVASVAITMNFDTIGAGDNPDSYYNGGFTALGTGPGPAYGVDWPGTYGTVVVLTSAMAVSGTKVLATANGGDPLYFNHPAGFAGNFSCRLASNSPLTLYCTSDTEGTGSVLGTTTGTYGNVAANTLGTVTLSHTGLCKCVVIIPTDGSSVIYVDDVSYAT